VTGIAAPAPATLSAAAAARAPPPPSAAGSTAPRASPVAGTSARLTANSASLHQPPPHAHRHRIADLPVRLARGCAPGAEHEKTPALAGVFPLEKDIQDASASSEARRPRPPGCPCACHSQASPPFPRSLYRFSGLCKSPVAAFLGISLGDLPASWTRRVRRGRPHSCGRFAGHRA
jgi:hypothetical protein